MPASAGFLQTAPRTALMVLAAVLSPHSAPGLREGRLGSRPAARRGVLPRRAGRDFLRSRSPASRRKPRVRPAWRTRSAGGRFAGSSSPPRLAPVASPSGRGASPSAAAAVASAETAPRRGAGRHLRAGPKRGGATMRHASLFPQRAGIDAERLAKLPRRAQGRARKGRTTGKSRPATGTGVSRGSGEHPVNARPGERACHGGQAPGFRSAAGSTARKCPWPAPEHERGNAEHRSGAAISARGEYSWARRFASSVRALV